MMPTHSLSSLSSLRSDLPHISLEELNNQAAMLTRIDRKYILSTSQATQVFSLLPTGTHILNIAEKTTHSYSSTYFDTPDRESFFGAAHHRRRRFKVRLRCYNDSDLAFLEVKTRGSRGRTVKERIPYSYAAASHAFLNLQARVWVQGELDAKHIDTDASLLTPSLHGSYKRTTLLLPGAQGRATIDSELSWRLPEQDSAYVADDLVVVETKSGSAPCALDKILWEHGIRPSRISKYATAFAALTPSLPTNRWSRTLRRHFGSSLSLSSSMCTSSAA